MMRCRFLMSTDGDRQEFELVAQCQSQMKILGLLLTARPCGRLISLNLIRVLCITCIVANLTFQVLVALPGLTYNVDASDTNVLGREGSAGNADLSTIRNPCNDTEVMHQSRQASAQAYGIQSQDFPYYTDVFPEDQIDKNSLYPDDGKMYDLYRSTDRDFQESRFPRYPGICADG